PDISWSLKTPSPGGQRAVVRIDYEGSVGCNFYLAGDGQAALVDRTNGATYNGYVISDGSIFSFDVDTGGSSFGSITVDGRTYDGARQVEVVLDLELITLDGTPWGPCGQLPDGLRYLSECEGVGTDTLTVTIGSGIFDTGLGPYASLPVPRNA